ncbi:uncharacterized protein LOC113212286 [Frankliniella occidentalis]|uniref:Uncharacterized protein LOC113212286 n=1 Tax=Frankliniella occidentalis TaxID=133901 RepID=A0A9C6XQN3_FRAOC|nr:uncharacterized protein LOC113212286 [Frankliniella occidentalis]
MKSSKRPGTSVQACGLDIPRVPRRGQPHGLPSDGTPTSSLSGMTAPSSHRPGLTDLNRVSSISEQDSSLATQGDSPSVHQDCQGSAVIRTLHVSASGCHSASDGTARRNVSADLPSTGRGPVADDPPACSPKRAGAAYAPQKEGSIVGWCSNASCSESFTSWEDFVEHYRAAHHVARPGSILCPLCLANPMCPAIHVEMHSGVANKYNCRSCSAKLLGTLKLKLHMYDFHRVSE